MRSILRIAVIKLYLFRVTSRYGWDHKINTSNLTTYFGYNYFRVDTKILVKDSNCLSGVRIIITYNGFEGYK